MTNSRRTVGPPRSGPAPVAIRGAAAVGSGRGNGDEETTSEMDAAMFDLLSRSLPTSGPVLEPEPAEHAMLRPEVGIRSKAHHDEESSPHRLDGDGDDDEEPPSETSPLIHTRSSASAPVDDTTPLFLGGTSPRRFWIIFAQILAAHFLSCFDGTIMASSHPVITSYFRAANSASWLSTAFLLTSTAFQPLLGRLSDALGRKPLFILSMTVFALATAWCGVAQSIESFVAARAVCGLGAGGAMTLGSIITSDLVPIERRGAYQSYINVVYGVGSALGAALGGAMAETLGWRWEFGIQVPPLVLCIGIAVVAIPDDIGLNGPRKGVWEAIGEFDFKGSILLTLSTTFAILGLSLGGNVLPWSHPFVVASLCTAAVCFPTFIWIESRVALPIMPPDLIKHSPRANLIFSNFIAAVLSNSILFNIPIYFQAVLLSSATSSGLRLVLPSIVSSLAGALTGFAITWTRRLKWPVLSGALWYLAGCTALCLLQRGLSPVVYLLILVPSSLGQGFQFPGTFMAVLAASPQADQAVVTSTLILWRSVGMVLGVATSSLVVQNALVHYLGIYVQGEDKAKIIERVRQSVEAIAKLEEPYREQVVRSYEASLRLTFIFCTLLAVVSLLIILPMRLPRLALVKRKS